MIAFEHGSSVGVTLGRESAERVAHEAHRYVALLTTGVASVKSALFGVLRPGLRSDEERRGISMANLITRRVRTGSSGKPAATMAALLVAGGVGALAEYFFFDRQHGARRRHMLRDRARAALRRRSRDAVRRAKYLEGVAEGVAHKAAHAVPGVGGQKEPPDDVTLAQKVESIAFRKAGVPKGQVSVNADNAVIYLRGHLESDDQIEELVRATHAIEGVNGVKNLLHTPPAMTEGA